ncbi:MAG: hypothetical protein ACI9MR_003989 [Myxococcota bacterium]|jgi:hypothetical protein
MADGDEKVLDAPKRTHETFHFGPKRVVDHVGVLWNRPPSRAVKTWRPPTSADNDAALFRRVVPAPQGGSEAESTSASLAEQIIDDLSSRTGARVDPAALGLPSGDGEPPPNWTTPPPSNAAAPKIYSEDELTKRVAEEREALLNAIREPTSRAVQRLDEAAQELERHAHLTLLQLATKLASSMVGRALELDQTLVVDMAQRALRMAGPLEKAIVRCHPDDVQILRGALSPIADEEAGRAVEVIVRPGHDIGSGGVLVTYETGIVDARIDKGMERLSKAVRDALNIVADEAPEPQAEPL